MPVIIRPPATVLPPEAELPERNYLRPAPNVFSHELAVGQPYYHDEPLAAAHSPAGGWAAGTPLLVLRVLEEPDCCWVADGSGRYVVTPRPGLRRLAKPPPP